MIASLSRLELSCREKCTEFFVPDGWKGRPELQMGFTSMIFPNGYTVLLPGSVHGTPGNQDTEMTGSEGTIKGQGGQRQGCCDYRGRCTSRGWHWCFGGRREGCGHRSGYRRRHRSGNGSGDSRPGYPAIAGLFHRNGTGT